jgi:Fuc2NAc and GlcNAc transferase
VTAGITAPAGGTLAAALAAAAVTMLVAAWIARWLIGAAPRLGLQDVPNHRSSHVRVTPRGGGAAIVLATLAGAAFSAAAFAVIGSQAGGPASTPVANAVAGLASAWWWAAAGGLLLAAVGLVDDVRPLSYRLRLVAQALAVAAIVWAAAVTSPLPGNWPPAAGWVLAAVLVLGGVWWVNLFNFMDGIDGIAASEALFLLGCALLMHGMSPDGADAALWCAWILIAAVGGFLPLNWRPARIFLGDCGSLFLGVSIFWLAMHGVTQGHTSPWFWLIVTGAFVCDTTVTLFRRLLSRMDVTSAHRSHLYQRLARRWDDHAKVTLVYSLANLAWFLPLALMSHHWPSRGPGLMVVAYVPAIVGCWWLGAGRPDEPTAGPIESDDSAREGEPGPVTTKP